MGYFALDLETKSLINDDKPYALEPWRQRSGQAKILSLDYVGDDGVAVQLVNDGDHAAFVESVRSVLVKLKGQVVWAHYAIFDVAWLITLLQPDRCGDIPQEIKDIKWRDTVLLMKWLTNGQRAEDMVAKKELSYSLAGCVKQFMKEHPMAEDFIQMKSLGFGAQSEEYWLSRGSMDVIMTLALANKFAPQMPEKSRIGFMTESSCIVPVANSWINGIRIDLDALDQAEEFYGSAKQRIADELQVSPAMFSSPKQLAKYLFVDLQLDPASKTASGNPGTSKEDLMWIRHKLLSVANRDMAAIIDKILEAKESSTILSKYVKTTREALEYTGDGYIYGAPRLFGTYTGRMTYSNSTFSYKTGIALHQIPRKAKLVRAMLAPPPGMVVYEADAEQQESRLMAIRSGDALMTKVFIDDINFHSMTASRIFGYDVDKFEEARALEDGEGEFTERRQMGKLTNLSCNYRISGKALASQSYVKYGKFIDVATGNMLVNAFNTSYQGVKAFWDSVIRESKELGYTEEFGGRRFKLSNWHNFQWATESSAIMFPIQGAGASMKEIAIKELYEKVPELHFCLDLHDASFGFIREDIAEEIRAKADKVLNGIDYSKYWGFEPSVKLPYESKMGQTFKDVK